MILIMLSFILLFLLLVARRMGLQRKAKKHSVMISLVIICDIALVLYLAVGRHVLSDLQDKLSAGLMIHIFLALSCVVGYVVSFYAGFRLLKGDESARHLMKMTDRIVMPLRILVSISILLLKLKIL